MPVNRPDRLTEFSHRLAQIEYIVLKLVMFLVFLLWLGDKLIDEYKNHFPTTKAQAAEIQKPCEAKLPVFRSD